jgi:murein L,D-transpeptidase YafK
MLSCPDAPEPSGLVVLVDKSDLRLAVFQDGAPLPGPDGATCFPVALGGVPTGTKERRGDERTPTGTFRITHKNPNSSFHLSLGLDYPRAQDAEAGFAAGIIDARTRDRVVAVARAGGMPVRDTALGGDIYLHGGGAEPSNWTDGCVGMDDNVIDWLYVTVKPGTRVIIRE